MAFMTLAHYLQIIDRSWRSQDGKKIAMFLSIKHDHSKYSNYQVEQPEGLVERFLVAPIDELVILHLKCLYYIGKGDFLGAYNIQSMLVQSFAKILQLQKEENWALPIMYTVCCDLRLVAQQAEKQRVGVNEKPGEILEKTAECLMGCFRVCAADNRSAEEDTKRLGMLALVNQLFKVYFRINKLHLCKPLIRAIESSQFKESFSLSHQVTYK